MTQVKFNWLQRIVWQKLLEREWEQVIKLPWLITWIWRVFLRLLGSGHFWMVSSVKFVVFWAIWACRLDNKFNCLPWVLPNRFKNKSSNILVRSFCRISWDSFKFSQYKAKIPGMRNGKRALAPCYRWLETLWNCQINARSVTRDQIDFMGRFLPLCIELMELSDDCSLAETEQNDETRVALMQAFDSVLWLQGHATMGMLNSLTRDPATLTLGRCELLARLMLRVPEGMRGPTDLYYKY